MWSDTIILNYVPKEREKMSPQLSQLTVPMAHKNYFRGKICESSNWQHIQRLKITIVGANWQLFRLERIAKCSYFILSTQNIKFYWFVMKIKKFLLPIWWYNRGLFPLRNKYLGVFVLNGLWDGFTWRCDHRIRSNFFLWICKLPFHCSVIKSNSGMTTHTGLHIVTQQMVASTACMYTTATGDWFYRINHIYCCVPCRMTWMRAPGRKTDNVNFVPGKKMCMIKLSWFKNPISIVNKIAGYDIWRQNLARYEISRNKTYKWLIGDSLNYVSRLQTHVPGRTMSSWQNDACIHVVMPGTRQYDRINMNN